MTLEAPRWGRIVWPTAVILATLGVGLAVRQLFQGDASWAVWFQLIVHAFWGMASVWLSYLTFCIPVVRIDDETVAWRAIFTKRFHYVNVRDIVGYRMQDSSDLRLRLHSGEERSIHLSQVAKRDRPALVAAISRLVNEGKVAI